MTIKHNELVFIYNSKNMKEREALVYAKAIEYYRVREIDVSKVEITPTQIEFAQKHTGQGLKSFVRYPLNEDLNEKVSSMNERDLLTWLSGHPDYLRTPIALWKESGKILKDKYSLVSEGLELNQKRVKYHENA